MKKVFATWEKVFATWKKCLQHDVWMLVATCSPQARNMFATNSQYYSQHVHYVRGGGRGHNMEKCSQHGKMCSQYEKVFATSEKVFAIFAARFATS
jgi:hypothetical protein